jgi:hypothetical protein
MTVDSPQEEGSHLEWLVKSRSNNQTTTLNLYQIMQSHTAIISSDVELQNIAQELAAVAFSLWRAVFLSELTGDDKDRMTHVDAFLKSLITDNAVVYQTDKNSREWTFRYYINNSRYRLADIADKLMPEILDKGLLDKEADSEKAEWEIAQTALTSAIANFEKAVRGRDIP